MEVSQRRYRRVQRDIALLENDPQSVPEISKQQLRKLLTERRNVIGPNGEMIRIPKHMAVEDIIKVIKAEHGLSTAEITGILVALKSLANNSEFRGKVNRVVVSGIETPLRIERPGEKSIQADEEVEDVEKEIPQENNFAQNPVEYNVIEPDNRIQNTYTLFDNEEYKKRSAAINAITADRFRAEAAAQRKADEERKVQDEKLEKQLNAHYAEQNARATRRRRVTLGVAMLLGAMYVTGLIVDLAGMAKQAMTPGENLKPLGIHDTEKDKLLNVTPEVIAALSKEVTPIVNYSDAQKSVQTLASENGNYQSFDVSIDSVSQDLKPNTNLSNALNRFSNTAETPVRVGNIDSYQAFENLLESNSEDLYTYGPAYFANFSRQVVHGMLKDKYGAEKVVATYEKKGEQDQIYEFYIRYFKNGSSNERTPEGRVDMTRNAEGRLQTKEYHTLPYEVYEVLAMIGEFSDYSNTQGDGPVFDIEGYAAKFTDGDVERAKQDLKNRMTYGTEALRTLIKGRVRDEKVKSALEYR